MKNLFLVMALIVLSIGCQKQARDRNDQLAPHVDNSFRPKPANVPTHKPNEVLVKFKSSANKRLLTGKKYQKVETATMKMSKYKSDPYYSINVANESKAVEELKNDPNVEWAGLNTTHTTQQFNDPYWVNNQQWDIKRIAADVAWANGNVGSEDVYVAVLDEGTAHWFCKLNSKEWINQEEKNGLPGVDDDNNGYVDDIYPWNFFDNSNIPYTGNNDHGIWCASHIGGEVNNGMFTVSIAPRVKLISVKFLSNFGYDVQAAKAIDYIIWLKEHKNLNIVAISNSWGGGQYNQLLRDAIHRAYLADISFPCAAGNSAQNTITNPMYPAAYDEPNIISVGASNEQDNKAFFSNYSTQNAVTAVDLFAPGTNCPAIISSNHQEAVGFYSGTSMACPKVAAALALIASVNPNMNVLQRNAAVLNSVRKVPALTSYCVTGGILNLNNPVFFGNTGQVVPDFECGQAPALDVTPPTTMVLTLDSTTEDYVSGQAWIHLSWIKSTDANPIPYIEFQMTPLWAWGFEGNAWTGFSFNVPMDRKYTISGRAVDTWGNWSAPSNVITVDYSGSPPPTDNIPPTTPTNLTASNIQTQSFRLNWTGSTDNVGVTKYKVIWREVGTLTWTETFTTNNTPSYLVQSFVEPGITYQCGVMASDGAGNLSDTVITTVTTLSDEPPPPPPAPDTIPPVVDITNPNDGYIISSQGNPNVTIMITATDNNAVASVVLTINGVEKTLKKVGNQYSYKWNTKNEPRGAHVIKAVAKDAANNQAVDQITVYKN